MSAPVAPKALQGRKGKKDKVNLSSPDADDDLKKAMDLVINDKSIPPLVKAVMSCMFEIKQRLSVVITRNRELAEENEAVHARNRELEAEVAELRSQINASNQAVSNPSSQFVISNVLKEFILHVMANHAGDIVVVHVVKALWQEFRERNWREFEEFKEVKDQHFRQHHQQKTAMVVGPQSGRQARVVTISNPVATIMNDSMSSEKGYL